MDAPVNFESISKAEILLIKWPFLSRMLGLHGLKHCATFICFLLKCYLSASPGHSWNIFVRSKILTLQFCWFIEFLTQNSCNSISLYCFLCNMRLFRLSARKWRQISQQGIWHSLSLAGNSPGFQSKNRYLSEEPIWFDFGSCDGCLLQEPWSISGEEPEEREHWALQLPTQYPKQMHSRESDSLFLSKEEQFHSWTISNPIPSQIWLWQFCAENAKN